jgi:hypothetical protein
VNTIEISEQRLLPLNERVCPACFGTGRTRLKIEGGWLVQRCWICDKRIRAKVITSIDEWELWLRKWNYNIK